VGVESGGNANAVSSAGAVGLAQVLPSTAANPGFGVAPFDPYQSTSNLSGAAQYLSALYGHFGNWFDALRAYNAGPTTAAADPTAGSVYAQSVLTGAGLPASGQSTTSPVGASAVPTSPASLPQSSSAAAASNAQNSTWLYAIAIVIIVVLLAGGVYGLIKAGT
jgi:hypothetical protein